MMTKTLKWIGAGAGMLLAVLGILVLLGSALPVGHRATGVARIEAPPPQVWRSITRFQDSPAWRSDLDRVEILSGDRQGMVFREHGATGALTMRVERFEPPRRLVTRIADEGLPFGGTWTFEIESAGAGASRVRITEDGEIHSAFFRAMSRWFFGYASTLEDYLEDLARHHGQRRIDIDTEWEHV